MSDKLPYEDAFEKQMNNLPSPNEEASWQKMKQLLDEKDKRRPIIFFRNYMGWGVVALLLLSIGGYIIYTKAYHDKPSLVVVRNHNDDDENKLNSSGDINSSNSHSGINNSNNDKSSNNKSNINVENTNSSNGETNQTSSSKTKTNVSNNTSSAKTNGINERTSEESRINFRDAKATNIGSNNNNGLAKNARSRATLDNSRNKKTQAVIDGSIAHAQGRVKPIANDRNGSVVPGRSSDIIRSERLQEQRDELANNDLKSKPVIKRSETQTQEDSIPSKLDIASTTNARDTGALIAATNDEAALNTTNNQEQNRVVNSATDSSKSNPGLKPSASLAKKTSMRPDKKFSVDLGVGLHQQIPINGQQSVAVGFNGKGLLSNYIPSLYVRVERNKKWFMQAELAYATPQLVNDFSYFRKTMVDSVSFKTTSYKLQKTFYTDIPVTFNYYVKPQWSVGVGGKYGWLHGAVAEKEISTRNLQTQQSVVVNEPLFIKGFTDSFLYKSYAYLLLQSDYKWKNLSLGLRYSKGLQPYIKYTLPNGVVEDRKNWSLEFIVRLRLWRLMK